MPDIARKSRYLSCLVSIHLLIHLSTHLSLSLSSAPRSSSIILAPVRRSEYCHNVWCRKKTRMVWLFDGEKSLKIRLFISTEYTKVADTQTDTARPSIGITQQKSERNYVFMLSCMWDVTLASSTNAFHRTASTDMELLLIMFIVNCRAMLCISAAYAIMRWLGLSVQTARHVRVLCRNV